LRFEIPHSGTRVAAGAFGHAARVKYDFFAADWVS
jgi:hypothetical protein